jgi:deferrochelatase/peroxidase EfeB
MIGRWPSGAPLSKFPEEDPGGVSDDNDFLYAEDDPTGAKCPFGSHLRRMNPRDNFESDPPERSITLSNRHRLIRRARLYGEPIIGSPLDHKPKGDVGLYFNCFSADISRQFEFLQYTWSNYPKIKQLYNDPDPIIGVVENPEEGQQQQFTIQGEPYNKTVKNLKRFITIRGGAYFFFPSLTTIRYLCSLD